MIVIRRPVKCPAWEDGEHQFRPGFMVGRKTTGQLAAEEIFKVKTPDDKVMKTFTPLDRDDHRTDAKQCACGLVVRMVKK